MMVIDGCDDLKMRIKRQDAFWDCAVLDRPCVELVFPRTEGLVPLPSGSHRSFEERWMDVEFQAQTALAVVKNTVYMGDSIPRMLPNLGPDFFPALYGGDVVFEDRTSYIKPFLKDWADADQLTLSFEHPYWKKMEELYDAFLEAGENTAYIGWPDLHPGADCLVGLRGPQELALDLFDNPDDVKRMMKRVTADFLKVYDHYYNKLISAGQMCTGWPGIVSSRKWHVPSCDFSYMIGTDQFNEFFLEGLCEECAHMEANIFHLDGIGSLRHLDRLLEIKSLNAIQWIWGAGRGDVIDWLDVFKKVQAAGKGIQVSHVRPQYLDILMEHLRPEGIWMQLSDVESEEHGEFLLQKISKWV